MRKTKYIAILFAFITLAAFTTWANGNLFENGFETDDFTGWTKTDAGSILSIVSTSGLSMIGNWCLKEIYNGTNSASIQSSTYTSSFSNYYVRFYFQTNTVNSTARIIGNMNDGGANVTVGLSASNDLRLVYQSTITCGSPIVANTTYRIELHENINASTGGYELEVNGVSCGSDFSRNTSTYAPASFTLGSVSAYSSGVIFYYDQLGVGNVTWLGAYTAATMAGGDMSNVDN